MALLKEIEIENILNNNILKHMAYVEVTNMVATKDEISFLCSFYSSVEKIKLLNQKSFFVKYDINGENPFKQAYLYLKSLEEYADAEDC